MTRVLLVVATSLLGACGAGSVEVPASTQLEFQVAVVCDSSSRISLESKLVNRSQRDIQVPTSHLPWRAGMGLRLQVQSEGSMRDLGLPTHTPIGGMTVIPRQDAVAWTRTIKLTDAEVGKLRQGIGVDLVWRLRKSSPGALSERVGKIPLFLCG